MEFERKENTMDEVLLELVTFLKEVSPFIWETLIRQVYVEAFSDFAWFVILFVVCVCFYKLGVYGNKQYKEDSHSHWEVTRIMCFILSGAMGLVSPIPLVSGIKYLLNPEFYAIKFILEILSG